MRDLWYLVPGDSPAETAKLPCERRRRGPCRGRGSIHQPADGAPRARQQARGEQRHRRDARRPCERGNLHPPDFCGPVRRDHPLEEAVGDPVRVDAQDVRPCHGASQFFSWEPTGPAAALWIFLLLFTAMQIVVGVATPGWFDLFAKLTPARKRGRLVGVRNSAGGLCAFICGLCLTWILAVFPFPSSLCDRIFRGLCAPDGVLRHARRAPRDGAEHCLAAPPLLRIPQGASRRSSSPILRSGSSSTPARYSRSRRCR